MTNNLLCYSKARVEWIDIVKGFAIFLMVCGHTSIPSWLSKWIWSFHMPLFFLISGLLFNDKKYCRFGIFLRMRIQTLIVPYIFFTLINLSTGIFHLMQILSTGWLNGIALWFLPVLFLIEMYGYFLFKYKLELFGGFVLLNIGYLLYINNVHLPYDIDVTFSACIFYVIGHYFRTFLVNYNPKLHVIIILLLCNIILSQLFPKTDLAYNVCGFYIFNVLNALIGIFAFIFLFKKMRPIRKLNSFLIWGGKNTLIILGLSQLFSLTIKNCFIVLGISNHFSFILRHLILWVVLWMSSILINKYIPFLVGKHNK